MITEDYVSYEISELLKENGFDEECRTFYVKSKECGIELFPSDRSHNYNDDICPRVSAPTLQMAMKWLREVHNIMISIRLFNSSEPFWEDEPHQFAVDIATKSLPSKAGHLRCVYSTYEGACEAAIKYCLENLI